jgi:hypothetical protein
LAACTRRSRPSSSARRWTQATGTPGRGPSWGCGQGAVGPPRCCPVAHGLRLRVGAPGSWWRARGCCCQGQPCSAAGGAGAACCLHRGAPWRSAVRAAAAVSRFVVLCDVWELGRAGARLRPRWLALRLRRAHCCGGIRSRRAL